MDELGLTPLQRAGFACTRCGHDYLAEARALVAGAEGGATKTQPAGTTPNGDRLVSCAPACALIPTP